MVGNNSTHGSPLFRLWARHHHGGVARAFFVEGIKLSKAACAAADSPDGVRRAPAIG